jgi:hypothetical protein
LAQDIPETVNTDRNKLDKSQFCSNPLTMQRRTVIYISDQPHPAETSGELAIRLRQAVEARGDIVVATFSDPAAGQGKGRFSGWNALLGSLDGVDQVAVATAADLPGRTLNHLLKIFGILRDHGTSLCLVADGIDTATGSTAFLDLISAYRAAKLSQAIRRGQARAVEAGKVIGRPAIPRGVVVGIQRSLASGAGIRWTARRFAVSGGTVINIRKSMTSHAGIEAS